MSANSKADHEVKVAKDREDREQYLRGIAAGSKERVITENGIGEIYRAVFHQIMGGDEGGDWRGPVNVLVEPAADHGMSMGLFIAAVEFMTGTKPMTFEVRPGVYRLVSEGYRLGPAGS